MSEIRPMIADFAQSMEHRMRRGDRKGWVWNAVARHTADPHDPVLYACHPRLTLTGHIRRLLGLSIGERA
jgi:hypothetical protein